MQLVVCVDRCSQVSIAAHVLDGNCWKQRYDLIHLDRWQKAKDTTTALQHSIIAGRLQPAVIYYGDTSDTDVEKKNERSFGFSNGKLARA